MKNSWLIAALALMAGAALVLSWKMNPGNAVPVSRLHVTEALAPAGDNRLAQSGLTYDKDRGLALASDGPLPGDNRTPEPDHTPANPAGKYPWYAMQADMQLMLGDMFSDGVEVYRNDVQAYAQYAVAARLGSPEAAQKMKALAGKLTARQLDEARDLAAQLRSTLPENGVSGH